MRYLLVFMFLSLATSLKATFVEGPSLVFINPTNELHIGSFDTKTNAQTAVANYGILNSVGLGASGVITGTNSDQIINFGWINVTGSLSADGIFDKGGANFIFNVSNINVKASGSASGIRSLGINDTIYNLGSINSSHYGIAFKKGLIYNIGTIYCAKANCLAELDPGESLVYNAGTLISSNSPAINLRDGSNFILNAGPIFTTHPTAIETHGGDDTVYIGVGYNFPISGLIDGGEANDTLILVLAPILDLGSATADQRGTFLAAINAASPANGNLTFSSNIYTWTNFETLTPLSFAATPADFNNDGFNDLVLQRKIFVEYIPMSNNFALSRVPQTVVTLNKKEKVVAVNDFGIDMGPELVIANKSSVRILTGTNFSTNFAIFTLGKGEKIIGTGNVKTNGFYPDILTRKKKEIYYYRNTGTNFSTNSIFLYAEKDGYKFITTARFSGDSSIILRKKGKLQYRNITNLNAEGVALSLPKGYRKVIGAADFSNGGDMELIAIKGKKVTIGDKMKAYILSPNTRFVGPR